MAAGIPALSKLTEASHPSGAAVGNALEIAEAVAVRGAPPGVINCDGRALARQRDIVTRQTVRLLHSELGTNPRVLKRLIKSEFDSGGVLRAFNLNPAYYGRRNVAGRAVPCGSGRSFGTISLTSLLVR